MFSDGYKTKYFNQQLRRQSSSGSTGMPVNVYWDYKDWYASNMCLWRKRQEWYGIKPCDKYCIFTLNAFGIAPYEEKIYYTNEPCNILSFNISLVRDENEYERIVMMINDFQPDWLYIQPFILNKITMAYKRLNIKPTKSIKYLESVGEVLAPIIKRKAEEVFHIKVTNMYGSEEMNGIAIEDLNNTLHILSDNVFLEIMNEHGFVSSGIGETIITNLNNYAMPLIRYSQGDMINLRDNLVYNINGRKYNDTNIAAIGVNPLLLSEVIAELNNIYIGSIVLYKYTTNNKNEMICKLNVLDDYKGWEEQIVITAEGLFFKKCKMLCHFYIADGLNSDS